MRCNKCDYPMTALFTSYACDRCDGLVPGGTKHTGWVVWDPSDKHTCLKYVFRYHDTAEKWQTLNQLSGCELREVESDHEFSWYIGNGIIAGVILADRLIEVHTSRYSDSYVPGPYKAYLL